MTTYPQSRTTPNISPAWLWFGVLGGPVTWFVYLVVVWAVVEFGCRLNLTAYNIVGIPAMTAIIVIATIIAGLIAAAAAVRAFASRRAFDDLDVERLNNAELRARFMARVGLYLSATFLVLIIVTAIPTFFLSTCGGAGGSLV